MWAILHIVYLQQFISLTLILSLRQQKATIAVNDISLVAYGSKLIFVGGLWTIWVFGLKRWRRDPGMQIKLLPFFSSVPVAAILDFKMTAIFNIFWPTSQLLSYLESSKWWQNLYFLMIWIPIKVLRKLLVIFLLAAILDFKMAAIFNIFRPSWAPEGAQNGGKTYVYNAKGYY